MTIWDKPEDKSQWGEVTVPTDELTVYYRQKGLPPSLQILNPRGKSPFSCFPQDLLLNYLCKFRFRWRPFKPLATTYKTELPLFSHDSMQAILERKVKVVVATGPLTQNSFLTHCTLVSSASEPQKQAMPLLSVSPLHVTAQEGHTCWGELPAPLSIRRACSTVLILARA